MYFLFFSNNSFLFEKKPNLFGHNNVRKYFLKTLVNYFLFFLRKTSFLISNQNGRLKRKILKTFTVTETRKQN